MAIKHSTVHNPNDIVASADWNANHTGTSEPDAHAIDGAKHTGDITDAQHGVRTLANAHSHADLSNVTSDQHHAEAHNIASHSDTTATGAELETLTDGSDADGLHAHATNDAHVAGDGSDHADVAANTLKETNVTTDLSAGTRTATTIDVNSSDGTNATLVEADTTNAGILGSDKWDEIVANTAAKHTQNTDTILGTDCVALDHGAATTDMVINVCYGVGAPPAANTTTEGSLFVKYTA